MRNRLLLLLLLSKTKHFIENTQRKYCGYDITYELLKTRIPLKIEYQEFNKFKLTYKHLESSKYNLILVVFIENRNTVRIITTFPENRV